MGEITNMKLGWNFAKETILRIIKYEKEGVIMKYKIEITETLQKIVEVEAPSYSEAFQNVWNDYNNGDIVLSSDDFVCFDINEYNE